MSKLHPPALPLCGGCPCEAVRFAVNTMPLLVYACHCSECQRASGSSFGLSMPVAFDSFAVISGKPRPWRRTDDSGVESTSWFCGDCGGRIFGEHASRPEVIRVGAGTLDDTSWLRPIAHIYLRSAQAWQRIPNHAECFDILPEDFYPLGEKWRQMWHRQ
jgi:hypothetical protein